MLEKSRVAITTSLRQGRFREEGSGGSQRQIYELTDRNVALLNYGMNARNDEEQGHLQT
jgi:hypothetical protein